MHKIRELRRIKDITQQKLSESIGIQQNTLSAWEKGKHDPPLTKFIALADIFNVTLDELAGRDRIFGIDKLNTSYPADYIS